MAVSAVDRLDVESIQNPFTVGQIGNFMTNARYGILGGFAKIQKVPIAPAP